MGTTERIVLYAAGQPTAKAAADQGFAEMDAVEAALTDYRPDSEISRLGKSAGNSALPVSPVTIDALRAAKSFAEQTDGAFDPTIAPLVNLWREARRTGKLPSAKASKTAFALVGYRDLTVDATTARLARPGMQLDLGGIGKGFACDRALAVLRSAGCPAALVSAGGDFAAGDPPPGGWRIRIEGGPLLRVAGCGVSTSGATEQHVDIGGHRYSHILDPRTGQPVEHMGLVTVIAGNATASDAMATALSVLGPDAGLAILARRVHYVDSRWAIPLEARIRFREGAETHTVTTPGFADFVVPEPFRFVEGAGYRDLVVGDTPVWRTITAEHEYPPLGFKVYTHLYDPASGRIITGARLPLYPHHRGLYVGWQKVHDNAGTYNFWEVPDTSQRFAGFAAESEHADLEEAVEAARIEWTDSRGGIIVRELRQLRARWAGLNRIRIDVTSTLSPGGSSPVDLDGNAHHAGCQIRLSSSATELKWDRPATATLLGDDIWTGSEWTTAQFKLDGKAVSVMHADDPGNPRPVEYSTRPYGRFGSRFSARLLPGKPQTFHWHIQIGPGAAPVTTPPPVGATILFDGTSTAHWRQMDGSACRWTNEDGVLTVTKGDLITDRPYGDMRLHVEFKLPPSPTGATDQARTNSGVYIQQRYEIQILDSYGDPPLKNGCGAIYEQKAPDSNACLKPGEWQTYDIEFHQARWKKDGTKATNARVTVRQNGVLIQSDVAITAKTGHGDPEGPEPLPLKLQDHGHPVSFRNIWIAPL